jgi:hypothetical protein
MKASLAAVVAFVFALALASVASAQSSNDMKKADGATATPDSAPTPKPKSALTKEQKKANFKATEDSMQKNSTPGRAMVGGPVDKNAAATDPVQKSGNKKADFKATETTMEKASTPGRALVDNPVNKTTPAADPMKSVSKMTPEERAQLRKDVVKDAKP